MALGAAEVSALAQEAILVLLVDRNIRARADRVERLEIALATLLAASQAEPVTREGRAVATRRLLDRMVEFLRSSEDLEEISAPADVLRAKLRWVLARHAERPGARDRTRAAAEPAGLRGARREVRGHPERQPRSGRGRSPAARRPPIRIPTARKGLPG